MTRLAQPRFQMLAGMIDPSCARIDVIDGGMLVTVGDELRVARKSRAEIR